MVRPSSFQQIAALSVACILVFAFRIDRLDLQPLLGAFDDRQFQEFTPNFPGLQQLEHHEIFSPDYANTKKIVFLGASSVDNVGCDGTWHRPDPARNPAANISAYCTVAGQMNEELAAAGFRHWRAFNLARNGSKLTPMLYIYTQLMTLKPEIVVYGETFDYYLWENADANALDAAQYARMDEVFGVAPEAARVWSAYRETLIHHGWQPPEGGAAPAVVRDAPEPRPATSLRDLMVREITEMRGALVTDGPPLPVKVFKYRDWSSDPPTPRPFDNPDPGLGYFQAIQLFSILQERQGGKFFFYFSPQQDRRSDTPYLEGIKTIFGGYLTQHNVPWASHIDMEMKTETETYDGMHHTLYGTRHIAAVLLRDLESRGLIK